MLKKNWSGFALIELLLAMSIIALLFGLITMNLLKVQRQASLNSSLDTFIADFKHQQLTAMAKDTSGSSNANYGVYFEQNRYILFHGSWYSALDDTNFTVNLDNNLRFVNIQFPSAQIVFATVSGEIKDFAVGQNSVVLQDDATGLQKQIKVNRYGVITEIN